MFELKTERIHVVIVHEQGHIVIAHEQGHIVNLNNRGIYLNVWPFFGRGGGQKYEFQIECTPLLKNYFQFFPGMYKYRSPPAQRDVSMTFRQA